MVTETSSSIVPPEVVENINTLSGQVESLQKELAQALDVWKNTLAEEKDKFESLLLHKDLAAQEQDAQWSRQQDAFEERLADIKSEFEARLQQTEQNATRALSELDDAWQRDKLEWGPAAQAQWPTERHVLEDKVHELELELAELRREHVIQAGQPNAPSETSGPTPETVKALQAQLIEFQQTVASLQDRASRSDDLVNACVQALDYQISVLYDLVQHAISTAPGEGANLAQS